jgi:hypothetical protein
MSSLSAALKPPTKWVAVAAIIFAGCSGVAAPVTDAPASPATLPSPTPTIETSTAPPLTSVAPVSASKPSAGAADAFAKCHIGDLILIGRVTGMGQIASAKNLAHYVPLTGREPQLAEDGPAWIIQIRGDVPQPGGEVWTDPTCVVTQSEFGYFATGPVRNTATGKVVTPEPPTTPPDTKLPPLAP